MSLTTAIIERTISAQLSHYQGHRHDQPTPPAPTGKTVLTGDGPVLTEEARARDGGYEPILSPLPPKHERRFNGFDGKIIAVYPRVVTVREIQVFLAEQYATKVSPEFINSVPGEEMAEVACSLQMVRRRGRVRPQGLDDEQAAYG